MRGPLAHIEGGEHGRVQGLAGKIHPLLLHYPRLDRIDRRDGEGLELRVARHALLQDVPPIGVADVVAYQLHRASGGRQDGKAHVEDLRAAAGVLIHHDLLDIRPPI